MSIDRDVLRQFTPFNTLGNEYLDKALSKIVCRDFRRGQTLFNVGDRHSERLFLLKGKVELLGSDYSTANIDETSDRRRFALNQSNPCNATAKALGRGQLLVIESDFLDLLVSWNQSSEFALTDLKHQQIDVADSDDDWMSNMLQSPLMMRIPPANIQQLFARFEEVEVAAGEHVVREGERGDYFYVIEAGAARVSSRGSNSEVLLQPGNYFGEEALVGETLRNATVTMVSEGRLQRLDKQAFTELLQEPVMRYMDFTDVGGDAANQILDVRLPVEHMQSRVPGSLNIPLGSLRKRIHELPKEARFVVTDDGGRRSQVAVHLLCQAGFDSYILRESDQCYALEA